MKNGKRKRNDGLPHELEHACCWRCGNFIFKYGSMGCRIHKSHKVEPNHFCNENDFTTEVTP